MIIHLSLRALQYPKDYPELADNCNNVPDSSNRLTSPAPSSEAPSPVARLSKTSVDSSTQTDPCPCVTGVKSEEAGEAGDAIVEKRRGCPKGGWPGQQKKKLAHAFIQAKIKKLLEKSQSGKKTKFQCEMCLLTFKKLFKLRMHLIKSHTGDITEQLSNNADTKPAVAELMPERKSSRIEQKDQKEEPDTQVGLIPSHLKIETETPLHLKQPESESWTEGCIYNCMLCSKSFTAFPIYKHHIGDKHNYLIEDYRAKFGKLGETINKFKCGVCHQEMIHRHSTIKTHMKSLHNMSLEDYHTQYIKSDHHDGDAVRESEKSKPWYINNEGGQYVCKICGQEMEWSQASILNHLDSVHQCALDDYSAKYESGNNNISQTEHKWYQGDSSDQYQCLICNGNIAHKFNNISSHLNLLHDLSIQEYEQQYLNINNDDQEEEPEFVIDDAEDEASKVDDENYVFTEADIIIDEGVGEDEEVAEEDEGSMVEGVSETAWYHGSNLTCQICSKHFNNDQWYFHHFSKIHGMTKEQYNEQYGKELEIWNQYQCLICNSEIRWKYSSIRQHLRQVHNMTIQDYEARYMDAEAEAMETVETSMSEVSPPSTPLLLPPPPPLKASPAAALMAARTTSSAVPASLQLSAKGSLTFDSRPASQWYHGSDLTCEICQKQFVDFTYYCTHIRTVHQISKEQYNERYGTASEAFRLYRCLVCGISIKWTYQSICGHLKSHEISIKDYENRYDVLESQNTESGKISDLTMNAGDSVLVTEEAHQPAVKKQRTNDGFSSPMGPGLVEQRRMMSHKPARISADVSSPTGKWYNQCKFTCKACPEEKYFTVPQALRMHLNGIHSLSRKAYEAQYGNAETVTRYWTCLICNKELKCQKGIIIQHLLNVHQMELVDYERQYMDAGDQVVARENRKPRKKRMMNNMNNMMKNDSYDGPVSDLTHFLVQRMDEGVDNVSLEGPAITEEVMDASSNTVTSMSTLEVEGMEHVPWYFGCRYSCQICNKFWHYPQAARYHLDSVHKLSRAAYESQYGTCEVETRIFHCSLCQRTMKCERDIIKYHLEAKHQMSLEEYQDQFPNPVVTVGESRRSNAANHARTANAPMSLLNKFGVNNSSAAASSSSDSTQETELSGGKAPWYRGSRFTCIPCDRSFTAQVLSI